MTKKLLNDCFLHDKDRIPHSEAIRLLKERISPIADIEKIPLNKADGRVLAEAATALRPVPAHTNAAVDGYAFAAADYDRDTGTTFDVVGRSAAGHPFRGDVPAGGCVRILTGAVVPEGHDTVAMQEDCEVLQTAPSEAGAGQVRIPGGLKAGANVRLAGEDVAEAETLLQPGHLIRPQDLAALASIGLGEVTCHRRLRVAVVSTGDEIVPAGGRALDPGEVYDANTPMLTALCRLAGCDIESLGIWPDNAEAVRTRLRDAAEKFDVILTSGGASQGEEDHMSSALAALGHRHMWQIAVKPGRPLMFGQIGDTVAVGLPGNPVAVFVCFLMYVMPMLRRLSGAPFFEPRRIPLPATFEFPKRKIGRREFWRARLVTTETGLAVEKYARDGSGLISGLRASDGLIDIPEDVPAIKPGDIVSFIPFSEFGILGSAA